VSLQSALDRAAVLNADADPVNDIAEIWIAEGNYKPTAQLESDDVRSATFSLVSGVSLIGGFEGGETTVDERAVVNGEFQHEAILSGDLGTPDDNSDNAYTVVYCGENIEAGVDGVSVSGGNADVSSDSSHSEKRVGGGIYSRGTVTVTNSTLSGNSAIHGGGIINYGTLTVTNSTLSGNSASQKGGGILNAGTLTVTNSTLASNSAGDDGGGIRNYNGSTLTVTNSTLASNSAGDLGGGIINLGALTVTNSTLSGNSASGDGGCRTCDKSCRLGA